MRLACAEISKKFDGKTVLSSISLNLREGEILSVIGPSGSGKTTLVRVLSTLEKPDRGTLALFGKEIRWDSELIEVRRKIGYVQQKQVLLAGTVYDNIAIPLLLRNLEGEKVERKVERIADMLGIRGILKKNVRMLSGGEAQRVAFARGVVGEPELLFLDEFTANLDYRNAGILENQVKEFCDAGGSVLMVSHNLFQVRRMATRVAILIDGKIVEEGETEKVLENPRTELGNQFVSGKMPW
ncbi:MAG: ABC transporter ATP-binding protein [Thermoplasmata archaeon]|nr:ABC transporter ATP-binding protein [Thermoplasmata archaeon]